MNEVNGQTLEIVLDTLRHRGLDAEVLWAGLPTHRRQDWDVWVQMMARIEAAVGAPAMETLFVASGGRRMGHRFVQLANGFLSARDLPRLLARWGRGRGLTLSVRRSSSERASGARGSPVDIVRKRSGSAPTLRFVAGMLRHMSGLQGLSLTVVRIFAANCRL